MSHKFHLLSLAKLRENTNKSSSRVIVSKQQGLRAGEPIKENLLRIRIHTIVCLMYTHRKFGVRRTNAPNSITNHAKQRYKMNILAIKS